VISRQQRREAEEQNAYQALVTQSLVMASAPQSALTPGATPELDPAEPVEVADEPVRPTPKLRRTGRAAARRAPESAVETAKNDDVTADDDYEFVPLLVDLDAVDGPADRPAGDDGWDAVGNRRSAPTPVPPSPSRATRRTGPGPDAAAQRAIASHDGESREKSRKRRTQAIALLGAAGILAGGGGWVVTNANAAGDPRSVVDTPGQPTINTQEWVRQAKVSLASISRQLDIVAQVEELWNRSAPAQNGGAPPAAVQAMLDRKAALEQQRATVQSWLAAVESVDAVSTQLAQADAQLAAIDRALASPASGPETPQSTQLRAQRDFVKQQRDAKAAELDSLKNTVNHVTAQPLPDPAREQETQDLGQRVTNLASDPNAPDPGQEHGRLVPMPAIASRNSDGEPNNDPGTGAPPRPGRGSPDEHPLDSPGQGGAGDSSGVVNSTDGPGQGQGQVDPASYNVDPTTTTADSAGNGTADGPTRGTTDPTGGGTGENPTPTAAAGPGQADPQAAPVGKGPNGEVLTQEQQIRYDGLQERRAINDAELLAKRAADRQPKQVKLDKMRTAENKNLTPLQRQKKDIAREAKDLRLQSAYSQGDKITIAQRDANRAKLDADPNASFRTGAPKPKTNTAATTTKADPGNKQTKTAAATAKAKTTTVPVAKQQKVTTPAPTPTPTPVAKKPPPTPTPTPATTPAPVQRKT
jgi:hypothetical protein